MRNKPFSFVFLLVSLLSLLKPAGAQEVPRMALEMSQMTPGLISIAMNTQYFTDLAPELDLTPDQIKKLQDLVYESVLEESRLTADLKVATAQIERLLAEPEPDLEMLKQRLDERYHLAAQADFFHIQKAMESLKLLTHEQHVKAFPALRKLLEEKRKKNQQNEGDQKL